MRPESLQEPEISAVEMLGYLAAVLGYAQHRYRSGAATATAIGEALDKHTPPEAIATACRAAWAAMVVIDLPLPPATAPIQRERDPFHVERRDIEVAAVAKGLRAALGVSPRDVEVGAHAAIIANEAHGTVRGADVASVFGWTLMGLTLFAEDHPSLTTILSEVKSYAVALAMVRARGNYTVAGRLTGVSAYRIRERLRHFGLHPWQQPSMWAKPPFEDD